MRLKILVILLLSFFIFCGLGCSSIMKKDDNFPASNDSKLLEPSTILKFADIPVPMGFKLMLQNSYSFESGGVRVGALKYQGNANIEQVVNFYKDQMPLYNWSLLNVIEYGERMLNFERDNETCIITLLPKSTKVTLVTVSLGPKSQIASKSSQKTAKPIK